MTASDSHRGLRLRPGVGSYGWWTIAGAAFGFGLGGILTFGAPLLLLAVVMAASGVLVSRLRCGVSMVLVGLSAAPWVLAWLNRGGPGPVCQVNGTTSGCTQAWSPWPLVAVAVILIVAGIAVTVWIRRRTGTAGRIRSVPSRTGSGRDG